jgi:hypothetical protein
MKLAKIVDNMPYCPICNMLLGNMTGNYDSVEHEGKRYVKFERFCNGRCGGKYVYYSEIGIETTKRYVFAKNVKVVKED